MALSWNEGNSSMGHNCEIHIPFPSNELNFIRFLPQKLYACLQIICILKKYKKGLQICKITIHFQITVTATVQYPPSMQSSAKYFKTSHLYVLD